MAPALPRVLVQAERLGFAIDGRPVFADLSFVVAPGLTLVRGGDGRGKTSLLRLLAGRVEPTSGHLRRQASSVHFDAIAGPSLDPVPARTWLQSQAAADSAWRSSLADDLMQAFGLAPHLDKPLHMLSTGSRRKVGLVAALAGGAELTLLDLPFAALDAPSCRVLGEVLAGLAGHDDRAWVIADHVVPPSLADVPWAGVVDLGD